jgi:multidrug efflux pump subunit AcrA (membrane-fusion protein)
MMPIFQNNQNRRLVPLLIFSGLVICATLLASFLPFGKKADETGIVRRGEIVQRITVAGTVQPARKTLITAPYNGYVHKVYVKVGQEVKTGDPVVSLVQTLRQTGEPVYPLRAPFGGIVVQVNRSEGEYVTSLNDPNSVIVRIDELNQLFLSCEVPESSITGLKPGMEVIIKPNSTFSQTYKGVIQTIALAAKEGQWGRPGDRVNFDVRIRILNQDDQIRPGMSSIIDIITAKRTNILLVNHEFVEKKDEDFFVTLANGEKRKIEVGISNEEAFEVIKGLSENERIKLVDFYSLPPNP